jgi:hypothetical protein
VKRSNKRRIPSPTARTSGGKHGTRNVTSEKTFLLQAFVNRLWRGSERSLLPRLVTVAEIAGLLHLEVRSCGPRLSRELKRSGAVPVPRLGARKKFRDRDFMPQLWLLSHEPVPEYLSTVGDCWDEYELQPEGDREAQRIARMTLNRQAADGLIAGAFTASKRRS